VTPESQGMSSDALRELSEYVRGEGYDVRSMIVLRYGNLVLEWYSKDVDRDSNHNIYSITKSVVATLMGIAIEEGDIDGVREGLGEVFPDSDAIEEDPKKAAIAIEDLLTMRSGLPCARANKPTGPEREWFDKVQEASDRLEFILEEAPMVGQPGKAFVYGNMEPQLAMAAIEEQSGERAMAYAEERLFDPLEFENAEWMFSDNRRRVPGGYGLRLRAIDLAKLGQLYLQGGKWRGKQVVDEGWIDAATKDQTGAGYGYYWWVDASTKSFSGKGVRGQRVEVYPELGLVFVVTEELAPEQVSSVTKTLSQRVLAAVTSNETIVPNPEAEEALDQELLLAKSYLPQSRKSLPKFRLPGN